MTWNLLWTLIAGGVGGVGSVAIAAFTKLGDRLSEYLVSRQIESFKHGLETQIEQLRARLAHITDRGMRSNELEYKAIIAAWESFVDAYIATHNCVISFIRHPNFERMTDDELARYLKNTEFSDEQQQQILSADNKTKMYVKKIYELRLIAGAERAIFDARSVLRKQGIFVPKELEDEFEKALQLSREVVIQRTMEFEYGNAQLEDKKGPFFKEGPRAFEDIKQKVRTAHPHQHQLSRDVSVTL